MLSYHQLLNFVVLITNHAILELKINWRESVISRSNKKYSSIADWDLNSLASFVVSVHSGSRKSSDIVSWGALDHDYVHVRCFINDDIDHGSISVHIIVDLYLVVACWIASLTRDHAPERKARHRDFLPSTFGNQIKAVNSASLCPGSSFAIWVCDVTKCAYRRRADISTRTISFALCACTVTAAPFCALSSVITVKWPTWSEQASLAIIYNYWGENGLQLSHWIGWETDWIFLINWIS